MDPEKFLELQKQMRENHQEVADFLSDFGSWKEQVESKAARLRNEKEDSSLPPIRNSLFKKQKKKRSSKKSENKKSEPQRIRSSDYQAWDKFDVDKALEELDKSNHDENIDEGDESSDTDEELENRRRIELSKDARELGNLRFKEGKFQEAIEQYTTSVRLTPEDPIPYTNRALAFLKLERYASAESDCSAALALDKKCLKALFRRALARKGLRKKLEAIEDLKNLLSLDEHNKAAITELTLLTGQPYSMKSEINEASNRASSLPKTSLRGSRKLRRIRIVEVGGESAALVQSPTVTGSKVPESPVLPTGDTGAQPSLSTNSVPSSQTQMIPSESITKSVNSNLSKSSNPPSGVSKLPKVPSTCQSKPLFTTPSNWYQLERDLRELTGGDRSTLSKIAVNYLCALEPSDYARIISSNLEPSFLSQLLNALHATDQLNPEQIASRLDALSQLPRFDVAWCLTDDHERTLFQQLLTRIDASQKTSADLKHRLLTLYA